MNGKDKKIYFISQYDNCVHNIKDWEHQLIDDSDVYDAYIGRDCEADGFRVDEEVTLYTIKEVAEFY